MRDYVTIGSTPCDETCVQVGQSDYTRLVRIESRVFIGQLERMFPIPDGVPCRYALKGFSQDFGTYHEVVCYYDTENESSVSHAFLVESESPTEWDDQALAELADSEYPLTERLTERLLETYPMRRVD